MARLSVTCVIAAVLDQMLANICWNAPAAMFSVTDSIENALFLDPA